MQLNRRNFHDKLAQYSWPNRLPAKDPALEWVEPEDAGWSSEELQEAHEFAIQTGCQAVMALHDGKVIFSRGNIHRNYAVDSIGETFFNALLGIHEPQGNINLNATLADLHIDMTNFMAVEKLVLFVRLF